jgi:glycosyltransferase involved in cell wall biosynthesis
MAAKIFPVTFSLTVHGPDEFYDVPGYRLAEKLSAANLVCAIGFFARSQLMKICDPSLWGKIRVTPLGVDPSVFTPRTPDPDSRLFDVVCVGRLVPAKGQHVLLAAVSRLLSRGRGLRLRLVGDGPDRESLERAARRLGIREHVIFEGAVNQDEIRGILEKADVFALASFAEGIPVVLMEAMAMEIPCVSTSVAGIPELIRDSVDGLLVAPSDEDGLAAAIGRLMDDGELRLRLGAAGRRRVIEKYDLRTNVARLATAFEESFGDAPLEAAA